MHCEPRKSVQFQVVVSKRVYRASMTMQRYLNFPIEVVFPQVYNSVVCHPVGTGTRPPSPQAPVHLASAEYERREHWSDKCLYSSSPSILLVQV